MSNVSGAGKSFLFLQGPHGPFFYQLATMLRAAGARVHRVGFNRGDEAFWRDRQGYIPYTGHLGHWPDTLAELYKRHGITDLVIYGDTRPVHAAAVALARKAGITVHCFEEGYLRPYWVTYERGGVNGNSRLMDKTVSEMRTALTGRDVELPEAPATWGDMRQHMFYGALYHFHVLLRNRRYPDFRPHRALSVAQEFRLYLRRLLLIPHHAAQRVLATRRIRRGGFAYHLVLLQLAHDASMQFHSPFSTTGDFLRLCMTSFAAAAPSHHHLVIKAHPLEDGRLPIRREVRALARECGISDRVHFVRGGKLAGILDMARSAVTVNSTAAQQALWRGVPVRAFGRAVYCKPEFLPEMPLDEFFAAPPMPDTRAYRDYRHYLLETSQIKGGYYSARGRRALLRLVVDMVLAPSDPYDQLHRPSEAPQQHIRLVT